MIKELSQQIRDVCIELFDTNIDPELSRPEEKYGDFASNVALRLSKKANKNPRDIAEDIKNSVQLKSNENISQINIEGPGFINFWLKDNKLFDTAQDVRTNKSLEGQNIVFEYSDPNPFKILHAGHLYTTLVGDVIGNILEQNGAELHRVNYGGDVGLHVAKSMWAILEELEGEYPEKLQDIEGKDKLKWLSKRYTEGNEAYENDSHAQNKIIELNKRIYSLHEHGDKNSGFAKIYWTCRQWSYDGFEKLYADLKVNQFEKYYPESSVVDQAITTINKHMGEVYEKSNGAIIFDGEKHGLHKRVFITKEGIPTYEAKDVGLILTKQRDYQFDRSVIITATEQADYMRVVLKSIEQFEPKLANSTIHLTHGTIKLKGGVKMSSRKGNFLTADDVLEAAAKATIDQRGENQPGITLGAVKYAFLKNKIGGDISYDPIESVSLEGNSGPYLQYALVRAKSILRNNRDEGAGSREPKVDKLDDSERSLARQLSMYSEVFENAARELSPHIICSYLYETCQIFNKFYENSRVIGDDRQEIRLSLVSSYKDVLERGLAILGIPLLDKM